MRRRYHKRVGIKVSCPATKKLAKELTKAAAADAKYATNRDIAALVISMRLSGLIDLDIKAGLASVVNRPGFAGGSNS